MTDPTRYRCIVADPPWPYTEPFVQMHTKAGRVEKPLPYPPMTLDAIAALPVSTLAESDSRLFLWTTNRFLPDAFGVMAAWGFVYRQMAVWHKRGGSPWGGSIGPNHAEYLLIGNKGNPPTLARWATNVIAVSVRAHSQKPDVFIDLIEQASPGPYLEMFSRRHRLGWDVWGNESANTATLGEAS